MMVKFVDFSKEWEMHWFEYQRALLEPIQKGQLILRDEVAEFEKELAMWLGVEHVVSLASGTDALYLSLLALGVKAGDEVITCSYTFRATIEAILRTGATPVLADLDEDWRLYKTAKTKVVIPCHLEGATVDWEPDDDIPMLEDACQAIGAKPLAGIASCYSFYPAKILGCLGDGGAVATNDANLAHYLRRLRNHDKGEWELVAFNSRLDNIQASLLLARLGHLHEFLARRKEIAEMYDELLRVETPTPRDVYQDYIIKVDNPTELQEELKQAGIETMLNGYPFPKGVEKKPKARYYEEHSLRLPCNETLTDAQIKYVIDTINGV